MNTFLTYWKPQNVTWDDPSSQLLDHAASNQFHRLHRSDRIYIITYYDSGFWLLGSLTVDAIVGQRDAAKCLGCKPDDLWEADYHVVAPPDQAMPVTPVRCEDALRRIQVVAAGKPSRLVEPFSVQHFRAMRQITPGSGMLFDDFLAANRNG